MGTYEGGPFYDMIIYGHPWLEPRSAMNILATRPCAMDGICGDEGVMTFFLRMSWNSNVHAGAHSLLRPPSF